MVQLLVEKVVVHPDGAVEVHHVLPFEEQPVAADQKKKASRVNFMSCDVSRPTLREVEHVRAPHHFRPTLG